MSSHHQYSPSSLERLSICPGSNALIATLPESKQNPPNDYSKEGDLLHAYISDETALDDIKDIDHIDMIRRCKEIVDHQIKGALQFHFEHHMELKINGHVVTSGTADVVAVFEDYVTVIDWKFGFNKVTPVEHNAQFKAYSLMAQQKFNKKKVLCLCFQPRVSWIPDVFEFDDYDKLQHDILNIIDNAELCFIDDLRLKADDKACIYCSAKPICNATGKNMLEVLTRDIDQYNQLSSLQMSELLTQAKLAKRTAEAIEKLSKEVFMNGDEIPGYKLTEKKGRRLIDNPEEAFETAYEQQLSKTQIMGCITMSISKLEKVYTEDNKLRINPDTGKSYTMKDLKQEFSEIMAEHITRGDSSMVLEKAE
jgi:hypothetical protein